MSGKSGEQKGWDVVVGAASQSHLVDVLEHVLRHGLTVVGSVRRLDVTLIVREVIIASPPTLPRCGEVNLVQDNKGPDGP